MKLLVKYNADVNVKIKNKAIIDYAIKKKNLEIVEFLVVSGAKYTEDSLKMAEKMKKDNPLKHFIIENYQ